jgi:hypothetical protein
MPMGPDFQPDVNLVEMLAYASLNPATVVVAFLMGRKANEKSKILIAAFAGAVAGAALIYLATLVRLWEAPELARAVGGIFIGGLLAGLFYAGLGYMTKPSA